MTTHKVKQGEDLNKIAHAHGFLPEKIWGLTENADLAKKRKPHLLREGDELTIPELKPYETKCDTGQQHCFTRKGLRSFLWLRFLDMGRGPRADLPYILKIKTSDQTPVADKPGKTDEDGYLQQQIPPNAVSAVVVLNPGDRNEEKHSFNIGHLDPLDEGYRGVQARLNNIGYPCGKEDDVLGPKTRAALRAFQKDYGLQLLEKEATKIEEQTMDKLSAF